MNLWCEVQISRNGFRLSFVIPNLSLGRYPQFEVLTCKFSNDVFLAVNRIVLDLVT